MQQIEAIRDVAVRHELRMHLDGARLMNACVATGLAPIDYAKHFDTVSICFSKGLGAPIGSAVAGPKDVITRAHRFRKMFGGAMRQAGILAAAAIYALDHHIDRLAEDHTNARHLAEALAQLPGISIDPATVATNIVYFDIAKELGTAAELCARLRDRGVRMLPWGPQRARGVTHLDISSADIGRAMEAFSQTVRSGF